MICVENNSMEAATSFALEWYLMKELDLGDDIFMFWRTEPTLMLGCYQNAAAEVNAAYAREKGIPIVRRVSGGGTIYTDPEGWQFSFLTRGSSSEIDFRRYMTPVVEALGAMGVPATFSDRNDILVGGRKVSGNAQYRSAGRTLHHGSLLFNTNLDELTGLLTVSQDKLISKGIQSVRQRVANIQEFLPQPMSSLEFRDRMLGSLLKQASATYALTPADRARVEEIAAAKFRRWEWNFGESPQFEITKSQRFAGGRLECRLNIKAGRVTACRLYGDFFSTGDVEALQQALIGCPYRPEDLRAALMHAGADKLFFQIGIEDILSVMV